FAEPFDDMADLLAQLVLLSSETSERSVEIDDDYLRLTTVHQAKGLEFPIVFVIGLAEGLFPLQRSKEAGGLEEERRLFYVAITRARDELYLTCPLTFPRGGAPVSLPLSSFLEELPDGCYKLIRVESHMGRY
ncbi:MAG: ATP-dependent helicase, partial [Candidatus Marinimicrobia bacterium]|nr:ATP-dependent helicase [Candidatus Neomarinimicrobiota bacterium]